MYMYDEYMQSILGSHQMMGHPMGSPNPAQMNTYQGGMENPYMMNRPVEAVEEMYPEMYKMVYPMVVKVVNMNNMPITDSLVDKLTDNVYFSVEDRESLENTVRQELRDKKQDSGEKPEDETRRRPFGYDGLRDLIRILVLRQLIDNRYPGHRHDHRFRPMPMHPQYRGYVPWDYMYY